MVLPMPMVDIEARHSTGLLLLMVLPHYKIMGAPLFLHYWKAIYDSVPFLPTGPVVPHRALSIYYVAIKLIPLLKDIFFKVGKFEIPDELYFTQAILMNRRRYFRGIMVI